MTECCIGADTVHVHANENEGEPVDLVAKAVGESRRYSRHVAILRVEEREQQLTVGCRGTSREEMSCCWR